MTRLDVGLLELRAKSIDEILEKAQILKQKADSVDAVVKDLEVSDFAVCACVCVCMYVYACERAWYRKCTLFVRAFTCYNQGVES